MDGYCNATILFSKNISVGINVWSKEFYNQNGKHLEWSNGIAELPDFIVSDFTVLGIKKAIRYLVDNENWLIGRGFPCEIDDNDGV